ncbi:MAG: DUF4397 domain-containing protein [Bacteroidota bacterium]
MKISAVLLFFAFAVIGLAACSKLDDNAFVGNRSTTLTVINASTDTLNFYQNGTRLNNTSNLYPFGQLSSLAVIVGDQNFQFKKAGSPNTLVNVPFTIQDTTRYTMFFAGESTDKVFMIKDTIRIDSLARIRFVNASPVNVDIAIGSGFNYKNRSFKSATPFVAMAPGKIALSIYQAGTTTLLASGTLTLAGTNAYTLYTKGVLNGVGNNLFGARILTSF